MNYREHTLAIDCEGDLLPGIVSGPTAGVAVSGVGVVIVVGGPQYRVGSHRQFTLLARALAAHGHHCLRFDYRGMGDSPGAARDFERVGSDVHAAIEALRADCPGLGKVALWGLCDGASACLLYVDEFGARAKADMLCLVNPWVRSASSLAKTQVKHYYLKRLRQPEFWRKLLRGGTGLGAMGEFINNLKLAGRRDPGAGRRHLSYQERMAEAWKCFPGRMLLVLSDNDYVAKEFLDHLESQVGWQGLIDRSGLERHDVPEADHTFSTAAWRACAERITVRWLAGDAVSPAQAG